MNMKNLDYYLQHYNRDMTCAQVAQALGISASRCKTAACDFRRKGYDIPKRARPAGYVTEWQRNGGVAKRTKQPDGSWKYTPIGRHNATKYKIGDTVKRGKKQDTYVKTETGWEYVRKCPELSRTPSNVRTPAKVEKVAVSVCNERKRALFTDRNPAQVKVKKEEGGYWVRKDARTLVYKKQNAAA